jgi:hypothetical protein
MSCVILFLWGKFFRTPSVIGDKMRVREAVLIHYKIIIKGGRHIGCLGFTRMLNGNNFTTFVSLNTVVPKPFCFAYEKLVGFAGSNNCSEF